MQKSLTVLLFWVVGQCLHAQTNNDARIDYIKKYQQLAVEEMERTGIPASIKLAQAILESNAGQSTLAREANNHFGIKCGNNWTGKTFYVEDDDRDAAGNIIKSCFRKYKHVETSFTDHSEFLRDPKKYNRYGFLFKLNPQDYRSWAYGLQSAGYATASTYAESLISIIERYKLDEYDKGSSGSGSDIPPPIANRRGIGRVNDVKVVLAKEGETLDDIARIYRLKVTKLMEYNDGGIARSDKLSMNTRVFIQKKQKRWRGRAKFHFVRDEQTMFDISQQYGIQLPRLLSGNKMVVGEEPANGTEVRLRGFFWKKGPKPKLRTNSNPNAPRPSKNQPTPPSKVEADDETLFELGEGKIEAPKKDNAPSTGVPSTSGTPRPTLPDDKPTTTPPTTTPTKPASDIVTPPVNPTKPSQPATGAVFHTVVKGDTLFNISKRYNTTVAKIKELNKMDSDYIQIGQQLRVQ